MVAKTTKCARVAGADGRVCVCRYEEVSHVELHDSRESQVLGVCEELDLTPSSTCSRDATSECRIRYAGRGATPCQGSSASVGARSQGAIVLGRLGERVCVLKDTSPNTTGRADESLGLEAMLDDFDALLGICEGNECDTHTSDHDEHRVSRVGLEVAHLGPLPRPTSSCRGSRRSVAGFASFGRGLSQQHQGHCSVSTQDDDGMQDLARELSWSIDTKDDDA